MTFTNTYHAWMEDRRGHVAPASADRYEYMLERFVLPELGNLDIEDISQEMLGELVSDLTDERKRGERALGSSTAETILALTNNILDFARRGGASDSKSIFRENISKDNSTGQISEKNHYTPLSPDEIARVISCARFNQNPEMVGVLLSLYTGIGTGELCALSWDDVDLKRREIFIHNTLYRLKDHDGGERRTRLAVMEVRRSSIRSVSYPAELDNSIEKYYKPGTVFLTGEKDKYIEQRTFCNHLEKIFSSYGLKGLTLQRVTRTYKDGLADIRYLQDSFYRPMDGQQTIYEIDEKWLLEEMEHDLAPLRGILGLTGRELGQAVGMSEGEYMALETGEEALDWNGFLSFLFFFKYNAKTEGVVEALGLYPQSLREKLMIRSRSTHGNNE